MRGRMMDTKSHSLNYALNYLLSGVFQSSDLRTVNSNCSTSRVDESFGNSTMALINPHLRGIQGSSSLQSGLGNGMASQNSGPMLQKETQLQSFNPRLSPIPQAPSLNLPKGGGAIRGLGETLEVDTATGTASASIPIQTSPARNGAQPDLTLKYNSGNGNGPFGLGWQLDGIPSITRKTNKGLPQYNDTGTDLESDVFILDGAEDLVPVFKRDSQSAIVRNNDGNPVINESVQNGYIVRQYMPRIEGSFIRIERLMNATDITDVHWRTISPTNVVTIYGIDANSRVFDPNSAPGRTERIVTWLISESYDSTGNAKIFNYVAEDSTNVQIDKANEQNRSDISRSANRYIKSIKYGNRSANRNASDWTAISAHTLLDDTWMFAIIFDYGEHDLVNPKPDDAGHWLCRQDPFSTYRSGFEIRTYRLCRRILRFHILQELDSSPTLVSSTNLTYMDNPVATYMSSVIHTGYVLDGTKKPTIQKSLPPLTFSYSTFPSDEQLAQLTAKDVNQESLENLPCGLDDFSYEFVDLYGEGLAGILSEEASAWYYKENLSANNKSPSSSSSNSGPVTPKLGPIRILPTRPSISAHQLSHFGDITGSGTLDLISNNAACWGYYEKEENDEWSSFNQFASFPTFAPDTTGFKLLDLTGDGLIDILLCADKVFYWYPSLGKFGYGPGSAVTQPNDENKGPIWIFSDTEATVYLADMTGDGLSDLVRIKQTGGVCYWPNLGYGRFGPIVQMDNPPFDSPDIFNEARIQLADIDGSGTADIVYMGKNGAVLFVNQSGNSFSDGKQLGSDLPIDQFTKVSTIDLLGNGTTCLVCSSSLPSAASASMKYVDPMEGRKPHLLTGMNNNLGVETRISYSPSTKFFLDDKEQGIHWVTRLPFPVQCVEKQEIFDHVSGNRFTKRFRYSHGFFDGVEREFRGFARVDTWDAEDFKITESDTGANLDPTWEVPPVMVKTWYHTGAYLGNQPLEDLLASEYYGAATNNSSVHSAPLFRSLRSNTILSPDLLKADELREAYRAMKGQMLRQETYADDKSAFAAVPYSIEESSITIEAIQEVRDAHLHSIFMSYARENVKYSIDRKPDDPRIAHTMTLEVNKWGRQTKSLSIAYGRKLGKSTLGGVDKEKQEKTLFSYFETDYTNDISTADDYRLGVQFESRQYELTGFAKPVTALVFAFDDFAQNNFSPISSLATVPFEQNVTPTTKRLVARNRVVFRSDDLSRLLAPGALQPLAIPGLSHQQCLTPGLLAIFQRTLPNQPVENLLPDPKNTLGGVGNSQGGYVDLNSDGNWWKMSGRGYFHLDPNANAAAELSEARTHFFRPRRFVDAFGNNSFVNYDDYSLMVTATEDALQNTTSAVIDYRILGPTTLTDQNGNQSSVAVDALGVVTGTAIMGKPGENIGDDLNGFNSYPTQSDCDSFFSNPRGPAALSLLGNATSRVVYDVNRYYRDPSKAQPAYAAVISRETHVSDLTPGQKTRIRVSISFSDGFSRTIQVKSGADAGPVSEGRPAVSDRWVTSGWSIFNNKGAVVRTFEPFFDEGNDFKAETMVGVSSITMYDPVGRKVALLAPNHSLHKVIFAPWSTISHDFNDTILISDPSQDADVGQYFAKLPQAEFLPSWYNSRINGQRGADEQNAAMKAALHSNTPSTSDYDALGRTILVVSDNGSDGLIQTRSTYDIQGNMLEVYDDKERLVSQMDFSMCGSCIHVASMDAAERWTLVDASDRNILAWTSRGGHYRTKYDALRRPVAFFWSGDGGRELLVQNTTYGESQSNGAAHNLRGKVMEIKDQAGIVSMPNYDWKGNNLQTIRQFAKEYKARLDWSSDVTLIEDLPSSTSGTYDAYNRPVLTTSADGSITLQKYDERGFVIQILVNLKGKGTTDQSSWQAYVKNVDRDAKGQMKHIDYGNGVSTVRSYDPGTFRLQRLQTSRPSASSGKDALQDLQYTYDPVGNVSHIRDNAIQTVYFRNGIVDPSNDYTYDAVYRLIRAAGREHLGTGNSPVSPSAFDTNTTRLASPADGNAMAAYIEEYKYDTVGNVLQIKHSGSVAAKPGWTKSFSYGETSQIPGQSSINNRLSSTNSGGATDSYRYEGPAGVMGGMTSMPQTSMMTWDFLDQLSSSSRQITSNGGTSETTFYVYDSSGVRVRKITERQAAAGQPPTMLKERRYLGPAEVFRKYAGDGTTVTLERETLSVPGVSGRAALVESRTVGETDKGPALLIRYQLDNLVGSAVLELDDQAQILSYEEYFPFGSTSCQTISSNVEVPKRYRFTGKERDEESGLYYHGSRYYAPWINRWTSCDPAGFVDGLNLYVYARNQPTILTDPSGQESRKKKHDARTLHQKKGTKAKPSKDAGSGHAAPQKPPSNRSPSKPDGGPGTAGAAPLPASPPPPLGDQVPKEAILQWKRRREEEARRNKRDDKPGEYDPVSGTYEFNASNPLFKEFEKEMSNVRERPNAPVTDRDMRQDVLTAEHDEMVNKGINIALKYARAQLEVENGPRNSSKADILLAAAHSYVIPLRNRPNNPASQDRVQRDIDHYFMGRLHEDIFGQFGTFVYDVVKQTGIPSGESSNLASPWGGRHWTAEGRQDFESEGGFEGQKVIGDPGSVSHQPYLKELEEVKRNEALFRIVEHRWFD
ncbi:SpvB-domain-containing protein [Lindgomyces ingoldianus]|uniref:SpvB-domain-containing protein n=1 Tax=Lindgomyces ingoldianus TaxID=673940 RepID=A0ACB6QRJ5_9PLEO|nr:SpvB-domain-containing protein [Lindgomyces ingoldianus]KAF2469526.1 SpvB-domain-containing protein [Lindgomyces ingoldianus]